MRRIGASVFVMRTASEETMMELSLLRKSKRSVERISRSRVTI